MNESIRHIVCVLCRSDHSGRSGEHVLPAWLLNDLWPSADGPYTTFRGGRAVTKRNGEVRTQTSSGRFKLPTCSACNGILNDRFERSAKAHILELFNDNAPVEARDGRVVGLWFVKTWLLLTHPELVSSDPGWPIRLWKPLDQSLYGWMTHGEAPPCDISAWLLKVDRTSVAPSTRHIPLPTVKADGRTYQCRVIQFGLGRSEVHLVHHPGWSIDHPLEAEQRAFRIWPPSHARLDPAELPAVPENDTRWLRGPTLFYSPNTFSRQKRSPLSVSTTFDPSMLGPYGLIVMSA